MFLSEEAPTLVRLYYLYRQYLNIACAVHYVQKYSHSVTRQYTVYRFNIPFVENLQKKITTAAVKSRGRQEDSLDINTPRTKREFHDYATIMQAMTASQNNGISLQSNARASNEDVNYMGTFDRGTHKNIKMSCNLLFKRYVLSK